MSPDALLQCGARLMQLGEQLFSELTARALVALAKSAQEAQQQPGDLGKAQTRVDRRVRESGVDAHGKKLSTIETSVRCFLRFA